MLVVECASYLLDATGSHDLGALALEQIGYGAALGRGLAQQLLAPPPDQASNGTP